MTAAAAAVMAGCAGGRPKTKIGVILPQTGDAAMYGQAIQRGVELAAERNKADVAFPVEIVLDLRDSGSDPQKAKALLKQFYGSGSFAVIGGVTSGEALAMAAEAKSAERVLLSPSASSTKLTGIAPSAFFRLFPTIENEASTMATFAQETLKIADIVVLAEDGEFGRDTAAALKEKFPAIKAEVLFTSANLGTAVAQAVQSTSKTVYVAAAGQLLVDALQALRQSGFGQPGYRVLTTSALAVPQVLQAAGDAACNIYFTQPQLDLASEAEPMKSFRAAYQAKYNTEPDLYSASGYDAFRVLEEAIRTDGVALAGNVVGGIRRLADYPGVTGTIQFRDNGDVQRFERIHYTTAPPECEIVDFVKWYEKRQDEIRKKMDELDRAARQLRERANN